jgi:hypothetical protein
MHGLWPGRSAISNGTPFIPISGVPFVWGEVSAVLRKPFKLNELGVVVERCLARAENAPRCSVTAPEHRRDRELRPASPR